jgi:hypothetical protein
MAITAHDIVPDSATNNFCTLNPLDKGSDVTISDGNLNPTWSGVLGHSVRSNFSYPKTGKWYLEVVSGANRSMGVIDISKPIVPTSGAKWPGADGFGSAGSYALAPDGRKVSNSVYASFLSNHSSGSIVKILYDADSGELKFGIDSGSLTTAYNISTDITWAFAIGYWGSGSGSNICNFGQDPTFGGATGLPTAPSGSPFTDANGIGLFYYQPPTGAKALCTANLPDFTPTVTGDVPQDYFKCVKYNVGTGSTVAVDVGFNADLHWIKCTTAGEQHYLVDTVRSTTTTFDDFLNSNNTENEDGANDNVTNATLTKVANGFEVSTTDATAGELYFTNRTYISWNWKGGGPPDLTSSPTKPFAKNGVQYETLSAANITAGTITPTAMSVNTDAGFSIVKYGGSNTTGLLSSSVSSATIPHGLNDCEFCIIKNLDNSNTWVVSHTSITPNVMALQDSGLAASTPPVDPTYGQITSLNSNTVTITRGSTRGDNVGENLNSWGYIMYCWHSVEGYSKFGSYEGSTALPFVFTGFKPSFLLLKNADDSTSWVIHDNARDVYNEVENVLVANAYSTETTYSTTGVDFLSNGFKLRGDSSWYGNNLSTTQTVIFMAFSEQPFKFSNAR